MKEQYWAIGGKVMIGVVALCLAITLLAMAAGTTIGYNSLHEGEKVRATYILTCRAFTPRRLPWSSIEVVVDAPLEKCGE